MLQAAVSSSPARAAHAGRFSSCMSMHSGKVLVSTGSSNSTHRTLSRTTHHCRSFSCTASASGRRFDGRAKESATPHFRHKSGGYNSNNNSNRSSNARADAPWFESRDDRFPSRSGSFSRPRHHAEAAAGTAAPRGGRGRHADRPSFSAKSQATPSEMFLEGRQTTMRSLEAVSKKIAAEAQMKKDLLREQMKNEGAVLLPTYKIEKPRILPGEACQLFTGSTQNRNVCPGDLVEIRRQGRSTIGIFCQSFDQAEGRLKSTSVVQGDKVMEHRTADVVFRVPGFGLSEKAIKAIGSWDIDNHPAEPPKGIARLAVDFAEQATLLTGTFFSKFGQIYDEFYHRRGQNSLTSVEAAQFVFGKEGDKASELTMQEVYAAHMYMTSDDNLVRFVPSVSVRWTGEYELRSPEIVESTETVVNWIRNDDGRIREFIDKARLLIEASKNGKRDEVWHTVQFSDSDRKVIEFLRQIALNGYERLYNSAPLSYLPRLLRPLNLYDDMEPRSAFSFLTEIGVWPAWHNLEQSRAGIHLLPLVKQDEEAMARLEAMHPESLVPPKTIPTANTVSSKAEKKSAKAIVLPGPTDLYKSDPCDSIRHDFGMLPVYTIDDASASELDDGVSLEPVPVTTLTPRPSTWVHVHVADPTSLLPPTHEISKLAATHVQSVYLPEVFHPMLPRAITEPLFSLRAGCERKVMSFSARLDDETGEVLEHKVRPGLVRNVITANYNDVDEYLSWDSVFCGKERAKEMTGRFMVMPETQPFHKKYARAAQGTVRADDHQLHQDLQRLQRLALAHMHSRIGPDRGGGMNFFFPKFMVEVSPSPLAAYPVDNWQGPIDFSQWHEPSVRVALDPTLVSPSRMAISEMMVIGGQVATEYLAQHGVPMLFRSQAAPLAKYRDTIERIQRERMDPSSAMLSLTDMLMIRPYISGVEITLDPLSHWMMGLKQGYTKVTSPLRRYGDMVAHWQLKGHLLGHRKPVFSREELEPMANMIRERERVLGMMESWTTKMWLYELLRRREAQGLSNVYEGVIMNPTDDGYQVMSSHYGFDCLVKVQEEDFDRSKATIGAKVLFEVVTINPQRPLIIASHQQILETREPVIPLVATA